MPCRETNREQSPGEGKIKNNNDRWVGGPAGATDRKKLLLSSGKKGESCDRPKRSRAWGCFLSIKKGYGSKKQEKMSVNCFGQKVVVLGPNSPEKAVNTGATKGQSQHHKNFPGPTIKNEEGQR